MIVRLVIALAIEFYGPDMEEIGIVLRTRIGLLRGYEDRCIVEIGSLVRDVNVLELPLLPLNL